AHSHPARCSASINSPVNDTDQSMNFISDNSVGVAPEIMSALSEANRGHSMPPGPAPGHPRAGLKMADIFERGVGVFPVAAGTAANALSIASLVPPYGSLS